MFDEPPLAVQPFRCFGKKRPQCLLEESGSSRAPPMTNPSQQSHEVREADLPIFDLHAYLCWWGLYR